MEVKVTQADRIAAWPLRDRDAYYGVKDKAAWMAGRYDDNRHIQAFAAHRQATIEECARKCAEVSGLIGAGCESSIFSALEDAATAIRALGDTNGSS